MARNSHNFLIWFDAGDNEFILPLPRPFVREPEMLSPVVWLVPGDTVSFYINTVDETVIDGNIEILKDGVATVVVNTVTQIDFPTGSHRYGSFVVPALSEGFCQLKIGTALSQYCWVSTAANAADRTAIVKFRNDQRLGGGTNVRWSYLPENFYQQFRIRLAMRGEEVETNKETYRESTTGKTVSLYSEARQIVSFLTPEYNYWGHRAIAGMLEHDTILINDQPYQFQTSYKSNMNEGDALSQGEFSLSDENTATINRN